MMKIKGTTLPGKEEQEHSLVEKHSSEEEEYSTGGDSPVQAATQPRGEQEHRLEGRQSPSPEIDHSSMPHSELQEGKDDQINIYPQRVYKNISLSSKSYEQDMKMELSTLT